MNKRIRGVASFLAVTIISTTLSTQRVFALDKNVEAQQSNSSYEQQDKQIGGQVKENIEEVKHANSEAEVRSVKPKIPDDINVIAANEKSNEEYSMKDLNALSYEELVGKISVIPWNNITDLFEYNEDAVEFYSDTNRMEYLLNDLSRRGKEFTPEDDLGIPTLIEVIRAGYYLAYYNNGIPELKSKEGHKKCIPAILAIQSNPNFKFGTDAQDNILSTLGVLINNTTSNADIVNNFVPILNQYKENFDEFIKDPLKGKAIYNIITGVQYSITVYGYENSNDYSKSSWTGKIDGFIDFISYLALKGELTEDNAWLINNGLYSIAKLSPVHSNPKEGLSVLTRCMEIYPYLSEQYLQVVSSIADNYNSTDDTGKEIDYDKVKAEAREKYLSKTYKFDDGQVVIKAGDKVTEEKINSVYWASKEVQAQFFRVLGTDKALENGNKDDVLTIVIYNSPKEYKLNRLINGLDVENGGMYIEGDGTFYTYERTSDESIYTLEELFRHEFTHYLQGRYLVPGMWGSGGIYEGNRLTWLEEGGAELFAGATRTENIMPRKSVVSNIVRTEKSDRYTVDRTMHSKYGSFDFYHYSFALQSYMYNKDLGKLNAIFEAVKSNDIAKYDELIKNYSSNSNLEESYQNYMNSLIKDYDKLTTPLVAADYAIKHKTKNSKEIYDDITNAARVTNVKTENKKSQFFDSFVLRGTYDAGKSEGKENDYNKMNKNLNEILNTLDGYSWSGYKTVTAYMVNYNVDRNSNVTWELVFNGILKEGVTEEPSEKPVVNISVPDKVYKNKEIKFTSNVTLDNNNKIIEYLWDFGDGNTSNEANPSHKYEKIGDYTVTLKVKDNEGLSDNKSIKIKVENMSVIKPKILNEVEVNDSIEKANGPILNDTLVKGNMENGDSDTFYFDVLSDSELNINVQKSGEANITWVLYDSPDAENYIAYANEREENNYKGTYKATKGRYYIVVYGFSQVKEEYTLSIDGNIGGGKIEEIDNNVIMEKENNNDFDTATTIHINDSVVKGGFSQEDNLDMYSFEVSEEGTVDISLTPDSEGLGVAWTLHSEKDFNKYIAYPHREGKKVCNKMNLKPGKYYLNVYRYEGQGDYTIENHFSN
ncbi:collagenase [Clostridium gasigenes]|uniref:collagenase n=1 Tax=Clostridium gasigenes TaxID=94869 RepID=UPI001C0D3998|nr:collagenase [Clostridium gasigenes]MBU3132632.1 collagenase [Clostridium gasigenes]